MIEPAMQLGVARAFIYITHTWLDQEKERERESAKARVHRAREEDIKKRGWNLAGAIPTDRRERSSTESVGYTLHTYVHARACVIWPECIVLLTMTARLERTGYEP